MNCIITLTDKDFNFDVKKLDNPKTRYGARGIVFNNKNEIAIINKINKNEYKLVGGGIEDNEDPIIAFKQEVLEEAGCKIEIDDYLGFTKEEKSHANFVQISYVYVAHVLEDTKQLGFTQKEINEGATLLWLPIEEALEKIKNSENNLKGCSQNGTMDIYHTKFIVRRDYIILKNYIEKYTNRFFLSKNQT